VSSGGATSPAVLRPYAGGGFSRFFGRIGSAAGNFLPLRWRGGEKFTQVANERFAILDSAENVTGICNPNNSNANNRQSNPQQSPRRTRTAVNGIQHLV
jgi:hypothetical protein